MQNDESEGEVDPRVKGELDSLNEATDEINRLETDLSEERSKFNLLQSEAKETLQTLVTNNEKSIRRARPYYDAMKEAKQADSALQLAVHNFQKANGVYRAAKETIKLAEQKLAELEGQNVDAAWQEMLNIHTVKVNDAEAERERSERLHQMAAAKLEILQRRVQSAKKKHKMSISRTKRYFNEKDRLESILQLQRHNVDSLQRKIDAAKARYRAALRNLELISSEIHEQRMFEKRLLELELPEQRERGEGCEDAGDVTEGDAVQLDTSPRKTYDDIGELQAELDEFDFDGEGEDDELSSEDDENGGSFSDGSSGRRSTAEGAVANRRHSSRRRRQASVEQSSTSSRQHRGKFNIRGDDHDDVFHRTASATRVVYGTLHGVAAASTDHVIAPTRRADVIGGEAAKTKATAASDDGATFDIFDELC